MNSVAIANAITFGLTLLLAVCVLAKRPSRSLGCLLLILIGGLLVWSGGAVWRALPFDHNQMMAAHHLVFLGVNGVPVTWLLLSLTATRAQFLDAHPLRALLLCVPGFFFYLSFVSNPVHGQFATIQFEAFQRGPLFWGMIAWAFICSIAGALNFVVGAHALAARNQSREAFLLVLIAAVPQVAAATYLFHILPWPMDPTPASLGISAALLYPLILRMHTFEDLPLMRQDVIEHLNDAVMISDPAGDIVDLNPAAQELLAPGENLRGTSLADALARITSCEDPARIDGVFTTEHASCPNYQTSDGRCFQLRAARVTGRDGTDAGHFVVLHDRSDEVRAERALRRAQKLDSVGMLASGIAHEINNPLAFVRANLAHLTEIADIAKRLEPSDSRARASVTEAPSILLETVQGIDRIAAVVSGIQRLSRDASTDREPIDLLEIVEEAVRTTMLSHGDCRIECEHTGTLLPTLGAKTELLQVLENLLFNAAQAVARQSNGVIRISTQSEAQRTRIDVEDNGPGIPDEVADRIFDPFFTTKDPDQGTGLGLSIVYELVRDHGGSLEVDASDLGGARFSFRLPSAPAGGVNECLRRKRT